MPRLLLWGALAVGISGCAGLGGRPAPLGVTLVTDRFAAPARVVRVAWSKALVREVPLLSYKPQEFASAASGDGRVFIGSSAKVFYCLRQRDGEVLWERPLTGGVSSEPIFLPAGAAGPAALVVTGDDDGALTAMDAATGAERWKYRVRGAIRVRPTFDAGMIFFTSGEGRLYAVDARSGAWRWQYEREVPENFTIRGSSGVLVAGGRAYAGFPDGYLAALNTQNGEVLWTRQLSGDASRFTDVDGTPILDGDSLYTSSYSGGVFALDIKDGAIRWRLELEGAGPLALDAESKRLFVAAQGGVHSLDLQGRLVWRQSLAQQGELSAPTVWGAYLLLSAAGGGQYLVAASSGQLLQFFDPGQGATGRPVAGGRYVYLLSNAGVFFALTTG